MRTFKIEHRNEISHFSQGQTQHSQYTLQSKEKHFDQYLTCQPYPRQITSSFLYFIVGVNFIYLGFVGAVFLLMVETDGRGASLINAMIQGMNGSLLVGLLSCSFFIKAIIGTTIILGWRIQKDHKMHKILLRFTQFAQMYLRVLVELDFMSSSFLLITQTAISMVNFSLSILIIGFTVIFLENYSSRKDEFFIGSVKFHLLSRMKIAIGSLTNFTCLSIDENQIAEYCFLSIHALLAIIMVVAYLNEGFTIYRSGLLKWGVFFQNAVYFSLTINMLFAIFKDTNFTGLVLNTTLTTAVFSHFMYRKIENKKLIGLTDKTKFNMQIFQLLEMLQESHNNHEVSSFLNGCLVLHNVNQCRNPQCFTHLGQMYDSKARIYCSVKDIHNDRISLTKFYIKCKFDTYLQIEPQNFNLMLSYAEFLYHQFDNIGLSLYWLRQVIENRSRLGLSSNLKLNGLIRKIREDNQIFCRTLYGRNFAIEDLIESEQINQQITNLTFQILQEKIQIWRLIQAEEIDISILRSKSQNVMQKIQTTNSLWMSIASYVQMSRHWKFQYLCFAIFFKNERLKNKVLEDFDSTVGGYKEKIFDIEGASSVTVDMFDANSCCIHTEIRDEGMFIKRVSKYFTKVTEYSLEEVHNSNVNILMPQLVAKKHENMLKKFSKEGKLSNEGNYYVKQVYIVNKKGYIVPVLKMYKEFVSLTGQLEYVCFLKKINEQECVFLCNESMEITQITEKCRQMITDQVEDLIFLKNVNLISLIPELAKYTKFKPFVGATIDPLPQVGTLSTLTKLIKQQHDQQAIISPNISNGEINNIKPTICFNLFYPQSSLKDYTYAYQNYHQILANPSLQRYYQCVNAISNKIQQSHHNVYNCYISIKEVRNDHGIQYFQVKLNKIRTNKPINSLFLIPRGKEEVSKDIELVTASQMPKEFGKNEEGTRIPTNLNIFLKQEANLAPKSNLRLKRIKTTWMLYFLFIVFLIFLNMTLLQSQFQDMVISVKNIESTGRVSIISSRLVNIYICKMLNITSNTSQIATLTQSIQQRLNSPSMRSAFFDQDINVPQMYYSINSNTSGFNQIDFLYFYQSIMRTMASTSKIDTQLYNRFMNYQFPAFNDFVNHTNINLNIAFNDSQENIDNQYFLFFLLQALLLCIAILSVLYLSYKFYFSMLEMVKIHCHFSEKDTTKIINHSESIIKIFEGLMRMEANKNLVGSCSRLLKQHSSGKEEPQEKCNLNKKTKKITVGKKITRDRIVYFGKVIACFTIFLVMSIGRNEYLHSLVYIVDFQQTIGQNYLNFVPTNYLTAQIVAQAYNKTAHPNFHAASYQPLLSNLNIISNSPYIGSTADDPISVLIKQFFYSDACAIINPSVLKASNISINECRSTANYSFKNGLRQYSKYQLDITQKIISNNYVPTLSELMDYIRSVDIYHILNKYIVDVWIAEYNALTTSTLSTIQLTTLLHFFLILLILLFFRFHIHPSLKAQYTFYRFFYNNMMPEYIISLEKITRSNLGVINFL